MTVRQATGPETKLSAALEHRFAERNIDARFALAYRHDAGWFDNDAANGGSVGAEKTWSMRPVLVFNPNQDLNVSVVLEHGVSDGDGPVTQNRYDFSDFDFAIDEPGFSHVDWRHVVVETVREFANGRIVNVFGLRALGHKSLSDIDSTTQSIFHLWTLTDQEQVSNELRYTGRLQKNIDITVGGYVFAQAIGYRERRLLRGVWGNLFGGEQTHRTAGLFANVDFSLNDSWVVSTGARYTVERKAVDIATADVSTCDFTSYSCEYDFDDDDTWLNVTPRFAIQRWFGAHTQGYGEYTRGFRSGGYNLRNTSLDASPGPFDEEEQDAFEIGLKTEFSSLRVNLAAFHSRVRDLQRQVTRRDIAKGAIQVTANTADATIDGVEAEAIASIGEACTVSAVVGITRGSYDKVRYDLDGDGSTIGDERLKLPRLAPLTFGVEGECHHQFSSVGTLTTRIGLAHRDDSEIAHDNTGQLDGGDVLDASIRLAVNDSLQITLFGRNLLDEVFRRSHFDLRGLVDSTYSPLKKGRIVGIETHWKFP